MTGASAELLYPQSDSKHKNAIADAIAMRLLRGTATVILSTVTVLHHPLTSKAALVNISPAAKKTLKTSTLVSRSGQD